MQRRSLLNTAPHRALAGIALIAVMALAVTLPSAAVWAQESATITPNYKDADLSQIIQAVSEVTGKNFIIDPRVNAKVTMLSATPMSPAAFYEAFLSVLQVYGYVAVPAGKVIKIVPNTDARQLPANDLPNSVSNSSDEIVTQIITMKNVSAAQLVPLLRPLIPQYGHLAAYPGGNMLIISDRANNVSRIVRIIRRMDESGDDPVEVVLLQNASANEIVRIVNQLYQAQGAEGGGSLVKMVADERTNSILISGERAQKLRLKALIVNLDTPLESGGDTQVRYLRYADAEKIAEKLKGQASATAKAQAGATSTAGGGANLDSSATIWADAATNALIITAPPKIMRSLMAVIDKLDIRRAQVEVEAIIVEVDANKSSNLGVQWAVYGQGSTSVPGAVSNLPGSGASIVDLITAAATGGTGVSSKTLGQGATLAIGRYNKTSGTNFAAILQALRSDGSSNIISTPSIVTMDNQEAEVKVTTDVPLVTGSYANTTTNSAGTVNPFQTIQRQELGTILKVTPQINLGDSVMLKIEQEDSSPGAKLADSADISTNKRSIKTTVLIEDGGIVVLGGLISDTVNESNSRVPFLGRIPVLGNLFKSRSGSRQRKNLMVFIRPKILRDGTDTAIATGDKYNFMREQQSGQGKGITLLPGERQPVLPVLPPPTPGMGPANTPAPVPTAPQSEKHAPAVVTPDASTPAPDDTKDFPPSKQP
jgi:general secretion pathway protein D